VPVYTSWLCHREKFESGWLSPTCKKSVDVSYIVNGYVNKVVLHIYREGLSGMSQSCKAWVNGHQVLDYFEWAGPGTSEHHIDITQYFKPRSGSGSPADEDFSHFEIEVGWAFTSRWYVTAYLTIDVTGTIIETSSYKGTLEGFGNIDSVITIMFQLMFLVMVMNLLMSMMSTFMGVFV
jgi:hypothetical protein